MDWKKLVLGPIGSVVYDALTSNDSSTKKQRPDYGDIISVYRHRPAPYTHFAIYASDQEIIHYLPVEGSDNFLDGSIQVTTMERFLDGATSYQVVRLKTLNDRDETRIEHQLAGIVSNPSINIGWLASLFYDKRLTLYSPHETVERARGRVNERNYNLVFNNCEHFAVWCKTGIKDSKQVRDVLKALSHPPIQVTH